MKGGLLALDWEVVRSRPDGSLSFNSVKDLVEAQWRRFVLRQSLELSLELSVESGTTDTLNVRAALLNRGEEPRRLVGEWSYEHEQGDWSEWFRKTLQFTTEPPTYIPTAQTMGHCRETSQPEIILMPGQRLEVSWTAGCGCLKPRRMEIYNSAPCLREPGRYIVQASFRATFPPGDPLVGISLRSRPVHLDFGGGSAPPRQTVLRIRQVDGDRVILEGGSRAGVRVGDRYIAMESLSDRWRLVVVQTGEYESVAVATPLRVQSGDLRSVTGHEVWREDTERVPDCAGRYSLKPLEVQGGSGT